MLSPPPQIDINIINFWAAERPACGYRLYLFTSWFSSNLNDRWSSRVTVLIARGGPYNNSIVFLSPRRGPTICWRRPPLLGSCLAYSISTWNSVNRAYRPADTAAAIGGFIVYEVEVDIHDHKSGRIVHGWASKRLGRCWKVPREVLFDFDLFDNLFAAKT